MSEKRKDSYRVAMLKRRKLKRILRFVFLAVLALLLVGCVFSFFKYKRTHFKKGTTISGVDCSRLTVEQAVEKLNMELENKIITFEFSNVEFYPYNAEAVNLELAYAKDDLQEILKQQNSGDKTREYSLDIYTFDEQLLRLVLENVFSERIIKKSEDAHLSLSDKNFLVIVPEVYGNEVDFEEAYALASKNLKKGTAIIHFQDIVIQPEVFADDVALVSKRDSINNLLSTKVTFNLANDTIIKLDNSIMVDWLVQNEDGDYRMAIDENLTEFVKAISKEASDASSFVYFETTDFGQITVPIPTKYQAVVDQAKERSQLKSEILSGSMVTRTPIYTSEPKCLDNLSNWIELDISEQKVLMYVNSKCVLDTPCVTGDVSDGYSTPVGLYYLSYKKLDDTLDGFNKDGSKYSTHVDYWMPFNGNIGFHDASWRNKFGGDIFLSNGSHGCINLPVEAAEIMYEHIDENMPIIIYNSKTK